jgi:hypothetical protein
MNKTAAPLVMSAGQREALTVLAPGKALRRGVFHSVPDLISSIEDYMKVHNNEPKPLVWTATAESILTKVRRGRVSLNQTVSQ